MLLQISHLPTEQFGSKKKVESARQKLFMDNYFVLNQQRLSDLHGREVIKQLQDCSSADMT